MSENAPRNRTALWLIALLCVAPVAASYYVFYFSAPAARVNYGDLIETRPLPVERLQLADGAEFTIERLRGKWVLLMVDDGACAARCRDKLFKLRQLRLAQGKDMSRMERAWLIVDAATPAADLMAPYEGTWLVRGGSSALLKALPASGTPADHIYLVDPLGNLVLRYTYDADPSRIIKDLTRLLKTSGIG